MSVLCIWNFLWISYIAASCHCHRNDGETGTRIIGGKVCPTSQDITYMVAITKRRRQKVHCGGSLLNSFWILTAAHCLDKDEAYVIAGVSYIAFNVPFRRRVSRKIVFYIKHRGYNHRTLDNDIGVLRISRAIQESDLISYVKLPSAKGEEDLSRSCPQALAMGWGYVHPTEPIRPERLMCVNLDVVPLDECQKKWNKKKLGRVVCALSPGKDSCRGDSGGPLMCGDVQHGIVSFGPRRCANPDLPVYTRVDNYLDFIRESAMKYRSCSSTILSSFARILFYIIVIYFLI